MANSFLNTGSQVPTLWRGSCNEDPKSLVFYEFYYGVLERAESGSGLIAV